MTLYVFVLTIWFGDSSWLSLKSDPTTLAVCEERMANYTARLEAGLINAKKSEASCVPADSVG